MSSLDYSTTYFFLFFYCGTWKSLGWEPNIPLLVISDPWHYGETVEIAVSINCPDPQNVWLSTLDIFSLNWDKNLKFFLWVKKNILQIVVINFVNIQLVEFLKKIFENLHLKKTHMRKTAVVEINTISN